MTQIITLALDGEAVPLKDMKVTMTMQYQEKDQSGQSSAGKPQCLGIPNQARRVALT